MCLIAGLIPRDFALRRDLARLTEKELTMFFRIPFTNRAIGFAWRWQARLDQHGKIYMLVRPS